MRKGYYEEYFGIYSIRVESENREEAIKKIEKKILSYKNGSNKGDYIKSKIASGHIINPSRIYKNAN